MPAEVDTRPVGRLKVLQYLWEMSRNPLVDGSYWPADSLDGGITKRSEEMWEMSDRTEKALAVPRREAARKYSEEK